MKAEADHAAVDLPCRDGIHFPPDGEDHCLICKRKPLVLLSLPAQSPTLVDEAKTLDIAVARTTGYLQRLVQIANRLLGIPAHAKTHEPAHPGDVTGRRSRRIVSGFSPP